MREGSLEAPTRQTIEWQDPDSADEAKLDAEMRRVFDICHGCRRCFNLCDSFPRLFDLIDNSPTGELDGVEEGRFQAGRGSLHALRHVLHDQVPLCAAASLMLDFPHLMLRHRAVKARKKGIDFVQRQLAEMDRNGTLGAFTAALANWATDEDNKLDAARDGNDGRHPSRRRLPKYAGETF